MTRIASSASKRLIFAVNMGRNKRVWGRQHLVFLYDLPKLSGSSWPYDYRPHLASHKYGL